MTITSSTTPQYMSSLLYRQEVWNIKVKDSVLDVVGSDNDDNLFAGLADGTMAIILVLTQMLCVWCVVCVV